MLLKFSFPYLGGLFCAVCTIWGGSYSGTELLAEKIECSKLSLAVYFADYIDPTTGILSAFKVFDTSGNPIQCDWGFTADPTDDSCMIWTRFEEPIDPESVGRVTFNGDTIFEKTGL